LEAETIINQQNSGTIPVSLVVSLLDRLDRALLVAERSGRIVFANLRARRVLGVLENDPPRGVNLFTELLRLDATVIFKQIESGEHEVDLQVDFPEGKVRVRVQWLPEPDWLVVQMDSHNGAGTGSDVEVQHTVQ
jgi:signal transduction histidine kinase